MKRLAYAVIPIVAMLLVFGSYQIFNYEQQVAIDKQNQAQTLVYQNAILKDQVARLQSALNVTSSGNGNATENAVASVTLYIGTHDRNANRTLETEGFVPDCLLSCNGITYYKDPTTVITNEGHDFIQYELTGAAHAVTPQAGDRAIYEGVSASATGAAVTDSYAGAGPCSVNFIIGSPLFNSLSTHVGTISTGTPSGGSVAWTVSYTWTYGIGTNTVNAGCLMTEITPSSNSPYIFAEISGVGPFTLGGGDTLQEVWSVTAT